MVRSRVCFCTVTSVHRNTINSAAIEIHETPWQVIARELEEEIGYTLDQLQVLQPNIALPRLEGTHTVIHPLPVVVVSHPYDLSLQHLHTDISWVFTTTQEPRLAPGQDESQDIKVFTKEQLVPIPKAELFENMRILSVYALSTCLQEWQQVPASAFRL